MAEYKNLLDVLTKDRVLPEGFDSWGIKSTRPDLTTRNGFQWPLPGGVVEAPDMESHDGSYPRREGDGLCVATTWAGMASGGFPARTVLLVAYRSAEARGDKTGKLRTKTVHVVALADGERLIREHGRGADLSWADLSWADLSRANLSGADLSRANLSGANLSRADLSWANLSGADLSWADLSRADLSWANLSRADLSGANLSRADLSGADLSWADLSRANLSGADLSWADLSRANLSGANLSRADLSGADLSRADLPADWDAKRVRDAGGIL